MKIHDLRPAPGSHRARTRVGRGIAAGKGKTAGRGTKGQKARSGGSIPPWFEGGQTPLHMRIPKLRGFKPRFSVEFEIVNVGAIASLVELGAFETGEVPGGSKGSKANSAAPITVNQDILRGVGLVRTLNKPLKILGGGELSTPLFVVADAFSKSAIAKIEAAGGSVSVLEVPAESRPAIGRERPATTDSRRADATSAAADIVATTPTTETEDVAVEATKSTGPAATDEAGEASTGRRTQTRAAATTASTSDEEPADVEEVEAADDSALEANDASAELPDTTDSPADGV